MALLSLMPCFRAFLRQTFSAKELGKVKFRTRGEKKLAKRKAGESIREVASLAFEHKHDVRVLKVDFQWCDGIIHGARN